MIYLLAKDTFTKNDIIKLTNYIHFTIPDEKQYNRFPVPGYKK